MIKINQSLKHTFPAKDIEAIAGDGYIYFDGDDGLNISNINRDPKSISASLCIAIVINHVANHFASK